MSYQPKHVRLNQTGVLTFGAVQRSEFRKVGKLDNTVRQSITLSPATVNQMVGKTVVLYENAASAKQRFRFLNGSCVLDAAMGVVGGGFTVEFLVGTTVKCSFALTAAGAAASSIVPTVVPTAGIAGEAVSIRISGAGSITSTVPITLFFEVSQESTA
jgi:hypothetical protein